MHTLTIDARPEFFLRTLDEARTQLRAVLDSMTTGETITSAMGDEIAGICGALRWIRAAAITDPEAFAETTFRDAPAPIPSERADYADLVDPWTLYDPWGESLREDSFPGEDLDDWSSYDRSYNDQLSDRSYDRAA